MDRGTSGQKGSELRCSPPRPVRPSTSTASGNHGHDEHYSPTEPGVAFMTGAPTGQAAPHHPQPAAPRRLLPRPCPPRGGG
ncbi:protein of unknown function [Streptomyces murinus]